MYVVFSMVIFWQLRNMYKISGAALAISTNEIQRSSHDIDQYKYNLSWCWTLWVKNSKDYWFHVLYIHNNNRLWQSQKWRHFNMIAAEQKTVVKRKRFDMCVIIHKWTKDCHATCVTVSPASARWRQLPLAKSGHQGSARVGCFRAGEAANASCDDHPEEAAFQKATIGAEEK